MIKYYAETWNDKIATVEVEKENALSVWIEGRASRKVTGTSIYADTWESAHEFLMSYATRRLQEARHQYDWAKDKLGNVKGMKKP